jgi:hypothetical protein
VKDVLPGLVSRLSLRYSVAVLVQARGSEVREFEPERFIAFNGDNSGLHCAKSIADSLLFLEQMKIEILTMIEKSKASGALCMCLGKIIEAEAGLCLAAENVLMIHEEFAKEKSRGRRDNGSESNNSRETDKGGSKH